MAPCHVREAHPSPNASPQGHQRHVHNHPTNSERLTRLTSKKTTTKKQTKKTLKYCLKLLLKPTAPKPHVDNTSLPVRSCDSSGSSRTLRRKTPAVKKCRRVREEPRCLGIHPWAPKRKSSIRPRWSVEAIWLAKGKKKTRKLFKSTRKWFLFESSPFFLVLVWFLAPFELHQFKSCTSGGQLTPTSWEQRHLGRPALMFQMDRIAHLRLAKDKGHPNHLSPNSKCKEKMGGTKHQKEARPCKSSDRSSTNVRTLTSQSPL